MNINALIAQGPTYRSPYERFTDGRKAAQAEQMNALNMQSTRQNMDVNRKALVTQKQEQDIKTAWAHMKPVLSLPETQREQAYNQQAQRLQQYGIKSPEYSPGVLESLQAYVGEKPVEQWEQKTTPEGVPYQQSSTTGERKKGITKSQPLVKNDINMGKDPSYEYAKERLKKQAAQMDDLEKAAESGYKKIKALDSFMSMNDEAQQGNVQPLITGIQNFLASFGAEFEGLEGVRKQEQAIATIQANYMQELGARGLTDQDMKILGQSLPRVNIDRKSREDVVRILRKAYTNDIEEWAHRRSQEDANYDSLKGKLYNPRWFDEYKQNKSRETKEETTNDGWTIKEI